MRGEVRLNGERVDFHWWNRLPSGVEIDLTREQFHPEEVITDGVAITRPPNAAMKRLQAEYDLLRQRVFDALAIQLAACTWDALSIAAIPGRLGLAVEPCEAGGVASCRWRRRSAP